MSAMSCELHGAGQTWPGAAASFVIMWIGMMLPMMLPSLIPMLRRYRETIPSIRGTHLNRLTAVVAVGYFFVWALIGVATFPLVTALTTIEGKQPTLASMAPTAAAVIVLIAGGLQFTAWKAHRLTCCRDGDRPGPLPAHARAAWRHGLRLGVSCSACCGNLMTILLVAGMMDLGAMAAVTAAITAERLLPRGEQVARTIGAIVVVTALVLLYRSAAIGSVFDARAAGT